MGLPHLRLIIEPPRHPANERFQQKAGKPRSRDCTLFRVLQFLPHPQVAQGDTRDGRRYYRPAMVARRYYRSHRRGRSGSRAARILQRAGLITATALAGCAPPTSPLNVRATATPQSCIVEVEGRRFGTDNELLSFARSWPNRRALVTFVGEVPYRCIGSTIFILQGVGFQKIDASELPTTENSN